LPVAPSASREGSTGSTGARSGPYLLGLQDGKITGKKGRQGGDYAQPQLPAYLLAVSRGLVRGVGAEGGGCGAGYVDLSTPGNVRRLLFFDPAEDNAASLAEWEKTVATALNRIAAGDHLPAVARRKTSLRRKMSLP